MNPYQTPQPAINDSAQTAADDEFGFVEWLVAALCSLCALMGAMLLTWILLCAASTANAQSPRHSAAAPWRKVSAEAIPAPVAQAALATVRVRFQGSLGTGVYLGDGLYLTAAHVGEGERPTGMITFKGGGYDNVKVVGKDPQYDLLLLQGTVRAQMPSVALHNENIGIGEKVFLVGCARGKLEAWEGPVESYGAPVGGSAQDWMDVRGAAIQGDSGGPVFTQTGRLCGVLWGENGRATAASNCGRVRTFLLPWNARLAAWQQTQCQGGYCPQPQYQYQQPQYQQGGIGNRQEITGTIGQPTPVPGGNAGWPTTTQPSIPAISDEAIAKHIFAQMQVNPEKFRGDKGEPGPKGDPGPAGQITTQQLESVVVAVTDQLRNDPSLKGDPGKDGSDGVSPTLDIEAITAEVLARLPPIPVQTYDRQNQLIDTEYYPFGTPIKLRYGLVE